MPVARLSPRSRVAVLGERLAARTSRVLRRGSGEMIGGKVALALAPGVLAELGAGRQLACVSGTNGKTTTTRLLAAALGARGPVVTNHGGANMTAGVVAALCRHRHTRLAALEVDEFYLPAVARALRPAVVVLLNISRDQLDRSNETRRIAGLWRSLGADLPGTLAVANADDPLVAWAAAGFARRVWVGAGQRWTLDARVCPACAALLDRADGGWSCPSCGLDRPEPSIEVSGPDALRVDGTAVPLRLNLPGRVNAANAAMALAAARELGVDPADALPPMSRVSEVSGRYSTRRLGGRARGWPTGGIRPGSGTSPSTGSPGGRCWSAASGRPTWGSGWPTPASRTGCAPTPTPRRPRRRGADRSTSSPPTPPSGTCCEQRALDGARRLPVSGTSRHLR